MHAMAGRMDYDEEKKNITQSWDSFREHWVQDNVDGSANLFTTNAINMTPRSEDNVN